MRDLVGLHDTVPIETFFPLMLFAILFGLSMDYEVFLISRINEEVVGGRDANESVTIGLGATGKIRGPCGAGRQHYELERHPRLRGGGRLDDFPHHVPAEQRGRR